MEQEDRLSNLPITILHDILSRLPTKYAATTSVLSKAWAETWSTFPNLSLSDTKIIGKKSKNFIKSGDYLSKRNKFIDHVDRTLLRFRSQGLLIKQFKLSVKYFDLHNLSRDVDLWLKLVSENGVEVLQLGQPLNEFKEVEVNDKFYILPTCVLEAKSLTKLRLERGIGVDISFTNRSIKFFSLQDLYLEEVLLRDDQTLKHLISCCPLIEYITLKFCYVSKPDGGDEWDLHESSSSLMKSVCMCGLSRLKEVMVLGIREVCVDSPCLEHLEYFPGREEPYKIDFENCKNLRELYLLALDSTIITSKWFLELFAKFPFLDTLELDGCLMSKRINISSVQLKVLSLCNCPNLKEVNIDAPNLLSCDYVGCDDAENSICFQRCSSELKVKAMFHIHHLNFYYFRKFIQNFIPLTFLTSVSLFIYDLMYALELVGFQVPPSLPPSVKHLDMMVLLKNETLYLPLVYGLFSNFCPTTISMSLNYCRRRFIKFLYETLMDRDEFEWFFCNWCHFGHSKYSKCWLHRLKDVKLESPVMIGKKVDLKNVMDKLENSPHPRNIIFRLES